MDLVTQVVLGASIGEATLGKKIGSKAAAWGALGGLLPDLDTLITPFFSVADGLLVHRGLSHSAFFLILITPLLALLATHVHKRAPVSTFDWTKLFFFSLITHPILDIFTSYGTGFLEPFWDKRFALSSIAIVDFMYTGTLLLALIITFFLKRTSVKRRFIMILALGLTTLFLGYSMINKMYATTAMAEHLAERNIKFSKMNAYSILPHNFRWMGVAEADSGYFVNYYFIFSDVLPTPFYVPKNEHLAQKLDKFTDFHTLKKFSKDQYALKEIDDNTIEFYDMRFGKMGFKQEDDFVFTFILKIENDQLNIEKKRIKIDWDKIF